MEIYIYTCSSYSMYYCMYIIGIYTVYTHLSHLRVAFFEQVQTNDPCVTLSVFMSQIIIHIVFFRGHFLEIKTLNTSTQWFQIYVLFSTPWGNDPIWRIILQMAGSTTTYRCVFLTPVTSATFEVSNLKDHRCMQIHRVPIGHQKGQELRHVQWRCFPGMLGPFVSCFRKKHLEEWRIKGENGVFDWLQN